MSAVVVPIRSENDQAIEAAYAAWKKATARLNLYWSGIDESADITKLCEEYDAVVNRLADYEGDSSLAVCRQLEVTATILAAREIDRDSYFAGGPAFALVVQAHAAVGAVGFDSGPIQ